MTEYEYFAKGNTIWRYVKAIHNLGECRTQESSGWKKDGKHKWVWWEHERVAYKDLPEWAKH